MNVVKQKLEEQNLLDLLGITSLPEEQKLRILSQSVELIEQRLLLRLQKSLPDQKREELSSVMGSGDPVAANAFITENAPDFLDWMIDETNQLKQELSDLAKEEI
jgi:hypothetical protein